MMKAKVIKQYRDKETKKSHNIGEIVEVTENRFLGINSTSFGVFLVGVVEKPPVDEEPPKGLQDNDEPPVDEESPEGSQDNDEPLVDKPPAESKEKSKTNSKAAKK